MWRSLVKKGKVADEELRLATMFVKEVNLVLHVTRG